jgi:hypothetical protein
LNPSQSTDELVGVPTEGILPFLDCAVATLLTVNDYYCICMCTCACVHKIGVYLSRYADYVLKYSNQTLALEVGYTVRIINV